MDGSGSARFTEAIQQEVEECMYRKESWAEVVRW